VATAADIYKRIGITKVQRDHYQRRYAQCLALGLPSLAATFRDLVEAWDIAQEEPT